MAPLRRRQRVTKKTQAEVEHSPNTADRQVSDLAQTHHTSQPSAGSINNINRDAAVSPVPPPPSKSPKRVSSSPSCVSPERYQQTAKAIAKIAPAASPFPERPEVRRSPRLNTANTPSRQHIPPQSAINYQRDQQKRQRPNARSDEQFNSYQSERIESQSSSDRQQTQTMPIEIAGISSTQQRREDLRSQLESECMFQPS